MLEALLVRIARTLDSAGIRYMVIGGQAVLAYGYTRLTDDIDLTVAAPPNRLSEVKAIARECGLAPIVDDAFVEETSVLLCEDVETRTRVDFIFSYSEYEEHAFERMRHFELGGYLVTFASIEDLIIHKVIANRAIDLRDAEEVLLRHPVDESYIRTWLKRFETVLEIDLVPVFDRVLRAAREE